MTTENSKERDEVTAEVTKSRFPALRKKLLWGLLGGVVLLILLTAILFLIRDVVVVQAVTRVGTYLTGTKVTVDSFNSTLSGTVELKGLKVANPAGYHNPYAFSLDRIYIELSPETLFKERIEIREITVGGMRVAYEPALNGSNLQDIQRHLSEITGGGAEDEDETEPDKSSAADDPAAEEEAGKQVVIRRLIVEDYAVTLASAAIKTSFTVPLPPVYMTDIGEGRDIAETMALLYEEMLKSVFSALNSAGGVVTSVVGDVANAAGEGVNDAGKQVTKAVKSLQGVFDGFIKVGK